MKLTNKDRRALVALGIAVIVWIALRMFLPDGSPKLAVAADPIPTAEKRLARLRQLAATVPGREQALNAVKAELAEREKGLIQAETAPQAQAQLMEIMRRVGKAQTPPVDVRPGELGRITPLGDDYGEVQVNCTLEGRIEELLNYLADLTRQPEILSTRDIRISPTKNKAVSVRLTVSGVVPRRLVPEKKGLGAL